MLARHIIHNKVVIGSLVVLVAVATSAIFAPYLAPNNPNETDLLRRLIPPFQSGMTSILGTDNLGRDILSRIIFGARVSVLVAVVGVGISGAIGVFIGVISGYSGGRVDDAANWLMNVQLAIPFILLAIAIVSILGPGLGNVILVLAITQWVVYSRVTRGSVLSLREQEFVEAARAMGASRARIVVRHILPNALAPLIVVATFQMARLVIYEASLSFLGLGVTSGTPSWGSMISDGRSYLSNAWWVSTLPGLAIFAFVLGVNVFGDWVRDEFDPRLKHGVG